MKRKLKRLTSIALAMLLTISGGVSFTDFKINNVQEVYAQTSSNVKFIPNAVFEFDVADGNDFVGGILSVDKGDDILYIDINGNILAKFRTLLEEINLEDDEKDSTIEMASDGTYALGTGDYVYEHKYHGEMRGDRIIAKNSSESRGDSKDYGIIDSKGNIIVPHKYEYLNFISDDRILFQETEDGKYGVLDINGKVVVPAKYDRIDDFNNGYARVALVNKKDEDGNWVDFNFFFIDKTGKEFLKDKIPKNTSISTYSKEGLISMKDKNGLTGYFDINSNKMVIPGQFTDGFPFLDGLAKVAINKYGEDETPKDWNYIDKTGKKLLPTNYESVFHDFTPEGYTLAKPIGKDEVHILNKNDLSKPYGIIKDAYYEAYSFICYGKTVYENISDLQLGNYIPFSDINTEMCGFTDLKGNVVIEPIFSEVTGVYNNKVFVNVGEDTAKEKGLKEGVYILDVSKGFPTIDNIKNAQVVDTNKVQPSANTQTNNQTTNNTQINNQTMNTKTSITAPTGSITYKVQKWDTLGNISLRNYGSYAYHKELYNINKNAFAKTKGKLVPGMEIILPAKIGNATRLAPLDTTKGKIHTVQKGETLGTISNKYYKTPSKYNIIFEANKDRIKKPNMIYEGQQIIIPNVK